MTAVLWVALRLHGVVDQVDAGWAFVEWEGRDFGYVAAELLPDDIGEGDPIVVRLRGRRPAATEPLSIEVPRRGAGRASVRRARPRGATRRSHDRDS